MVLSDSQIISQLGPDVLAGLGFTLGQIKQWRRRGIAWHQRPVIAELAARKNVELPRDFLRKKRPRRKVAA